MRRADKLAVPTEAQEQIAVIDWFESYALTKGFDPRLLCASGNAAKRSYALAAALKRQGMRSGYPDLFLALPRPPYAGLWLELKRLGWRVPTSGKKLAHHKNQLEILNMLSVQSYDVGICVGAETAIATIKKYIKL